jgi:hypothetical protein
MKLNILLFISIGLLPLMQHPTNVTYRVAYSSLIHPGKNAVSVADSSVTYPAPNTRYVFVVTTDGLRWQELFQGADSILLFNKKYVQDIPAYTEQYWAATPAERRAKLLPFLWSTFVGKGQLYGNRLLGSEVNTANNMWFSYPGYNEMFTGRPDDAHIFSNVKWTNPNETVLEYLQRTPRLQGKIAAYATWDAFSAIFREKTSKLLIQCGKECCTDAAQNKAVAAFGSKVVPPDFHTWSSAMQYVRENHPHLMYIGLDDTDSRAHEGHYDLYLDAAYRFDSFLAELHHFINTDTMYQGKTTILLTTDHGRGTGKQWKDHSFMITGSDAIWMGALGPDTPAGGEMHDHPKLYQKQIAQTIANFMGSQFEAPGKEVADAVGTMFGTNSVQANAQVQAGAVPAVGAFKK